MQKFNYHSHTYRCGHADLDMKDEEYIQEYIKMGFEKVAITDHCPEKNEIDKRDNMRMKYIEKDIQTIITTTELNNLDPKLIKRSKLFKIENGKLIKIKEVKENE